jgi:hypothetical protein
MAPSPFFYHAEQDRKSFRLFTSQLVVNGNRWQVDIVKAFGISPISVSVCGGGSVGEAPTRFEAALDVPQGGVL